MSSSIRVKCPSCQRFVILAEYEIVIVVDMTEGASYEPGAYSYICPACEITAWVPESSLNLVRLQALGVSVSKTVRSVLDRSNTKKPLTERVIADFRAILLGDSDVFYLALHEWLEGE